MTNVIVTNSTGSNIRNGRLCLSSGIVKFGNSPTVFDHLSSLVSRGFSVAEDESKEPVVLTPDEPKFIEEETAQKVVIEKASEPQSAPVKKNKKKK